MKPYAKTSMTRTKTKTDGTTIAITMVPLFPVASGFGSPAMDDMFLDITVMALRQAIIPLVSGGR
jgi:hypothetical protein